MNVLVACEESQTVCKAFRDKGHRAFSCDVVGCSGGHPEWHIMMDVTEILNGNTAFVTQGGGVRKHRRQMGFDYCASSVHIFDGHGESLV